jgi:hypothetical protein
VLVYGTRYGGSTRRGSGNGEILWELQMQGGVAQASREALQAVRSVSPNVSVVPASRSSINVDQSGVVLLLLAVCQQRIAGKCQQAFQLNKRQRGSVVCLSRPAAGRPCGGGGGGRNAWCGWTWSGPKTQTAHCRKVHAAGHSARSARLSWRGGSLALALARPGIAGPGSEEGVPVA